MSEYQYYEFRAIDRALTVGEQAEVAKLSSRVDLSPHHAVFTYSYGDFRGDPVKLLTKHFDAMLYLANWGSRWLYFRFPRTRVASEALNLYGVNDIIVTSTKGDHLVLGFRFDEEEGLGWIEGEGQLSPLLPVREQILDGDYRALYLAWLKANQFSEAAECGILEASVPAGLGALPKSLKAFIEFFDIDADLVAVAAEASPNAPPEVDLEQWLPSLAEDEQLEFLRRVVRGESNVSAQLRLRLRAIANRQDPAISAAKSEPRRRLSDLLESAAQRARQRDKRAMRQQEKARLRKLETVAQQESQLWTQVIALIAQKQTKAYDQAVAILKDLGELAEHHQRLEAFAAQVHQFQQQHSSLSGLRWRLQMAGLLPR